jgi:hypothetical protein
MPNQPNQGGNQGGGGRKSVKGKFTESIQRSKEWWERVEASWTKASLSAMSQFVSPFNVFTNFGKAVFSLLMLTLLGSVIAPGVGGMIIAIYALLIEPAFVIALVATVTAPLLSTASYAVLRTNPIVRPIYDFILLLTIGLPYALAWFWEGKILGVSAILLSVIPVKYIGWALVFFIITFFVAGFFMSHTMRYVGALAGQKISGVSGIMSMVGQFSTAMSIWLGALVGYVVIRMMTDGSFPLIVTAIGALGGFMLGLTSITVFRRAVPSMRYVPVTWNVVAMIIGISGLAGTLFYIYAIVAVTIYLAMLYVVSRDASWLWYMLIAVPVSPAVAYYLGYITKLLLDYGGYWLGSAIVFFVMFAFGVIAILALMFLSGYVVWEGLKSGSLVVTFITVIIAIAVFVLGMMVVQDILDAFVFFAYISKAYQYLIAPA